jgi:hypothetical protein
MITLIGILVGLLIFVIFSPRRVHRGEASQRIAEMYSLDTTRTLSQLKPETLEYKLLASGVHMQNATFGRSLRRRSGSHSDCLAFLPGLPAFILGGITAFIPYAWLDDKAQEFGREIDRLFASGSRTNYGRPAGR